MGLGFARVIVLIGRKERNVRRYDYGILLGFAVIGGARLGFGCGSSIVTEMSII